MFAAVFLIFVIPVFALLGVTYRIMTDDRQASILQDYKAAFSGSVESVEALMNELYTFSYRLTQTLWFKKLLYTQTGSALYTGDAAYDIYTYNDQLSTYAIMNDAFSNILLYFPGRDYIMSSMGVLYQPEIPDRLFKVLTMSDGAWQAMTRTREDIGFSPIQSVRQNEATSEGILFKYAFPTGSTASVRACMIVYIRLDSIAERIDPKLLQDGCGLSIHSGDTLLYQYGAGPDGAPDEMAYADGSFQMALNLAPNLLEVGDLRGTFAAIYLLCALIGLLLAWIVSDRLYRPLSLILRKLGRGADNSQEYKFIETEITNIVRQETDLKNRLQLQRPIMLSAVFDMLIHDRCAPDVEMEKMLELLRVSFSHLRFNVAIFVFESDVDAAAVESALKAQRSPALEIYYLWQGRSLSIIGNFTSDEEFAAALNRIAAEVYEAVRVNFALGVGRSHEDMASITTSRNQAEVACRQAYWREPRAVVAYESGEDADGPAAFSEKLLEKVEDAVCAGQAEPAAEQIQGLLNELEPANCSVNQAREIITRYYLELSNCALSTRGGIDSQCYLPTLLSLKLDIDRLADMASAMARAVVGQMDQTREDFVRRMTEYVDCNLFNPELSLTLLAENFGYTASYFSRLFKGTFECNFLEYVMERRIQQAKDRLKNTEESIASIAQSIGFGSDISFRRQFKHYTGMTPSSYRLINRDGG